MWEEWFHPDSPKLHCTFNHMKNDSQADHQKVGFTAAGQRRKKLGYLAYVEQENIHPWLFKSVTCCLFLLLFSVFVIYSLIIFLWLKVSKWVFQYIVLMRIFRCIWWTHCSFEGFSAERIFDCESVETLKNISWNNFSRWTLLLANLWDKYNLHHCVEDIKLHKKPREDYILISADSEKIGFSTEKIFENFPKKQCSISIEPPWKTD